MATDTRLHPSPDAVMRLLDAESLLMHLGSGQYFSLDEVGTRIWTLIAEGGSRNSMVDTLLNEYEVERAVLEVDVDAVVEQLKAQGFLVELKG